MIEKARKRYLWIVNTIAFHSLFFAPVQKPLKDIEHAQSLEYNISKRGLVARMIYEPTTDLTKQKKLARRTVVIEARAALCSQQETQRRSRSKSTFKEKKSQITSENCYEDAEDHFPMIRKPTHCMFCLGAKRKPYQEWMFEYYRSNKMMNEVEKHVKKFISDNKVQCSHSKCKVLNNHVKGLYDTWLILLVIAAL